MVACTRSWWSFSAGDPAILSAMTTLRINGVEIGYDEAGTGHPLLLIHEAIADRRMWDATWEAFSSRFRVIRMDMRGFGETPNPDGEYANWRDMAELLRALDATPAHVLGASSGAGAALALTLQEPALVDRLVMVAPGLPGWKWGASMNAANAAEEAAWEAGDMDEVAWVNVRSWIDGPSRGPQEVPSEIRQAVFAMQRHALDYDNDNAIQVPLDPPPGERLGEVQIPTLVLVGDLDQPDMVDIAKHLEAEIAGARLVIMPGVAHAPMMEAPLAFLDSVLPFLEA